MLDRATEFARKVVNGETVDNRSFFGRNEILSCQRHLNDLERQGTEDFPFIWNVEKADNFISFAETLTLAEGEDGGNATIVCYEFQCFIFGNWEGWVHKDTGYNRFRTSYIQIARQNGKSIGNSVPIVYYGNFDKYQYPQLYCIATKEDQAKIVLKEAIKFIKADPELEELFTIQEYKSTILGKLNNSITRALGRDTKTIDGFRPRFASIDEYHMHETNQMYKLAQKGTVKLKQCLISIITTAGLNLNSPCLTEYDFCVRILEGTTSSETHFIYITDLDKEDKIGEEIYNENNWQKSNPLWNDTTLTNMRTFAIEAKDKGGADLTDFLTKSLNVWVSHSESQYMNMDQWKECGTNKTLEDMRGCKCFTGLDLSSGGDLCSINHEFPRIEVVNNEEIKKYFIHSHSFMPANRLEERMQVDKFDYKQAIARGELTLTYTNGGIKTDYKYILAYIQEQKKLYNIEIEAFAYDPHNADAFLSDLCEIFGVENTVDAVEVIQSARNLNSATVDFRLDVEAKNIEYNIDNKLLTHCMANARTTSNSFKEIKLDKNTAGAKIDPIAAIIDSHHLARYYTPVVNIYETRGMRLL